MYGELERVADERPGEWARRELPAEEEDAEVVCDEGSKGDSEQRYCQVLGMDEVLHVDLNGSYGRQRRQEGAGERKRGRGECGGPAPGLAGLRAGAVR